MSREYTPVKPGDIVFKEPMSQEDCIKTLAAKIRVKQKEQLDELKSISMWKLMFDEVIYELPGIIAAGVIFGLFAFLFLPAVTTLSNSFLCAIVVALISMLVFIGLIAMIEFSNTKDEIKTRETEYKEAMSLSDKELMECNFEYNPFEYEVSFVDGFYNVKNRNIVAMTHDGCYRFKHAYENGDISEVYLSYETLIENINIESKLLIELTEDFKIVVRTKEYCFE